MQVILFYTTAAVMPEDGTVHFAEDIYGHDARARSGARAAAPRAVTAALPGADAARVDVDEIGGRVVADAAAARRERRARSRASGTSASRMSIAWPCMCRLLRATPSLRWRSISLVAGER